MNMTREQITSYLQMHQGDPAFIVKLAEANAALELQGRIQNPTVPPQQTVKDKMLTGIAGTSQANTMPYPQSGITTASATPQSPAEVGPTVHAASGGIVAFAEGSKGAVRASTSDSDLLQNMAIQNSARMAALRQQLQQAQAVLAAVGNSGDQGAIAQAAQTVNALQDQVSLASQDIQPAEQAGQPAPAPGILDRISNYFSSSTPSAAPTPAAAQPLTQVPDNSPTSFQFPPMGLAGARLGNAPPSGQQKAPPSGKGTGIVPAPSSTSTSASTTSAASAPTDQMTELKKYMDLLSEGDKGTTAASAKSLADLKEKIEGQQSKFTPMDQALMAAGAGMLNSHSPYFGAGVGAGLTAGLGAYQTAQQGQNASALKMLELQDTQLKYQTALRKGDMKTAAEMLNQMNMLHRYDQQNQIAREQLQETSRYHTGMLGVQRDRNAARAGQDQSARLAPAYNVLAAQVEKQLTGGEGYGQPDKGWVEAKAQGPAAAATYKQAKIMEALRNNPPLMKQYLQMGFTPGVPPSGAVANNYAGAEEDDLSLQ